MLRTLLIATALLVASGTALARDGRHDYGRVISVEPSFNISFGTRHYDGFRVQYESGGRHYWTHTPYHPGHRVVLPSRHYTHSAYGYQDRDGYEQNRHYAKGYREDRHDNRHDDRHDRRGHRESRRHDRH